jgi:hypothetical protein
VRGAARGVFFFSGVMGGLEIGLLRWCAKRMVGLAGTGVENYWACGQDHSNGRAFAWLVHVQMMLQMVLSCVRCLGYRMRGAPEECYTTLMARD